MSLFQNTLTQMQAASKLMKLNVSVESILSHPERIIELSLPVRMDSGSIRVFKAFRVQHSSVRGPYKGGIRFHQNVDMEEVKALATWMTMKCSVVGIALGGGKGGIIVNPKELSEAELERLTRAYAKALSPFVGPELDVPAPDVNTNPQIMNWFMDEYSSLRGHGVPGVITGKDIAVGGSQGRGSATSQGGIFVLKEYLRECGEAKAAKRVVVQGFGNAGSHVARLLSEEGFTVIAVSDSKGALYCPEGLDPNLALSCKKEQGNLGECFIAGQSCKRLSNEEMLELPCDILVLSALENQVTKDNAGRIQASLILELANGPVTPEADEILLQNGVTVIPDILANAGGVTVSYFELVQNKMNYYWTAEEVHERLKSIMCEAWLAVSSNARKFNCSHRQAAFITAMQRLEEAILLRNGGL